MSVRIINPVPDKSVVKEHICKNCGVTLSYLPKDVQQKTVGDYGGGSDTYYYITCPSCEDMCVLRTY